MVRRETKGGNRIVEDYLLWSKLNWPGLAALFAIGKLPNG